MPILRGLKTFMGVGGLSRITSIRGHAGWWFYTNLGGILMLTHANCVTLGKSLNSLRSLFPYQQNEAGG